MLQRKLRCPLLKVRLRCVSSMFFDSKSFGAGFQSSGSTSSLPSIYSLLASIQLAKARKAPKLKLLNARMLSYKCISPASLIASNQQVRIL